MSIYIAARFRVKSLYLLIMKRKFSTLNIRTNLKYSNLVKCNHILSNFVFSNLQYRTTKNFFYLLRTKKFVLVVS
jgi:hypothetical protein